MIWEHIEKVEHKNNEQLICLTNTKEISYINCEPWAHPFNPRATSPGSINIIIQERNRDQLFDKATSQDFRKYIKLVFEYGVVTHG